MAAESSPAFQFYPKDFLTDGNVAVMSLEERGAYITLLCLCWQECSLPNDTKRLAQIVGVPQRIFLRIWPAIKVCFTQRDDGRFIQGRLEKERAKQDAYRRRQSDAGKASAAARQPDGNHGSTVQQPDTNDEATEQSTKSKSPISVSNLRSPISDSVRKVLSSADADFERFRAAYPVSRRIGGKIGRKAFHNALKAASLDQMLTALEQQKRSEQWQNPSLIPHMTTWLNQERWGQELPAAGAVSASTSNPKTSGNIAALQRFIDRGRPA